jgi:hypothetical protein
MYPSHLCSLVAFLLIVVANGCKTLELSHPATRPQPTRRCLLSNHLPNLEQQPLQGATIMI